MVYFALFCVWEGIYFTVWLLDGYRIRGWISFSSESWGNCSNVFQFSELLWKSERLFWFLIHCMQPICFFLSCFKSQFLEISCLDMGLFPYIVLEPWWAYSISGTLMFSSTGSFYSFFFFPHLWLPPLFFLLFHFLDFLVLFLVSSFIPSIAFHFCYHKFNF